jgi:hypothetical protein
MVVNVDSRFVSMWPFPAQEIEAAFLQLETYKTMTRGLRQLLNPGWSDYMSVAVEVAERKKLEHTLELK